MSIVKPTVADVQPSPERGDLADRLAVLVRAATPFGAADPSSSTWDEVITRVVGAAPEPAADDTPVASLRHAARAVLTSEECVARCDISAAAYDDLVAAAVSRLVGVLDPVMRERVRVRAPERGLGDWLDVPLLALSGDAWLELLEAWPVLAFVVGTALEQWRLSALELLARLGADLERLTSELFDGVAPGSLVEVTMEAGDRHDGGRAVALLRFASGRGLVYKPRDLAAGSMVMALFDLLNAPGNAPHLPTRRMLARDGYGYEERLEPVATTDEGGFTRFYERLGALTRVMQLLGARDMWADNLLAVGDEPHLIDLECVLCPPMDAPPMLTPIRQALYLRREATVLPTAIPLAAQPPTALCPTRDIGCLSHVDDPVDAGGAGLPIGCFRPHDDRGSADPWRHADDLERGYRSAHAALAAQRDSLLAAGGPLARVDHLAARFLWRDTMQYVAVLHDSLAPGALESVAAREATFKAMAARAREDKQSFESRFDVARLSDAEADALRVLDVPHFFTVAGDTSIHAPGGVLAAGQFTTSGADALRARIAALDADDIEPDAAVLRAAVDAARGGLAGLPGSARRPNRLSAAARRVEVEAAVTEIAALLAAARQPPLGTGDGWLSVCTDPVTGVCDVTQAGADLVGGALGPALFWGELDALMGAPAYGALAVEVVGELIDAAFPDGRTDPAGLLSAAPPSSGLSGAGALVAVGTRVAAATGSNELDARLSDVRELVLQRVAALLDRADAPGLATLHQQILRWSTPPGGPIRLAALLRLTGELLVDELGSDLVGRRAPTGLDGLVPEGDDSIAVALADTWASAPFLLADPDRIAARLRARPRRSTSRGSRLAAVALARDGLGEGPDAPAPPAWAPGLSTGALLLLADEWQVRSHLLADTAASVEAFRCVDDLLARRRASGRFLVGRVAGDAHCLSALDGICAAGRVLLRVLEPSLPSPGLPE